MGCRARRFDVNRTKKIQAECFRSRLHPSGSNRSMKRKRVASEPVRRSTRQRILGSGSSHRLVELVTGPCHIAKLPHELLSKIFLLASPPNTTLPHGFELRISWVCSHWRAVATATTMLWSSVRIHLDQTVRLQPALLALYLDRAREAPLDVVLFTVLVPSFKLQCLERLVYMILDHASTWRTLIIAGGGATFISEMLAEVRSAPLLEQFTTLVRVPPSTSTGFFRGGTPRLKHLSLSAHGMSPDFAHHASNLLSLELGLTWCSLSQVIAGLRSCKQLTKLSLRQAAWFNDEGTPSLPVSLPTVTALMLLDPGDFKLLRHLSIPRLTHLSLTLSLQWGAKDLFINWPPNIPLENVQTVRVWEPYSAPTPGLKMHHRLPAVTELHVAPTCAGVLEPLANGDIPFPGLTRLVLNWQGSCPGHYEPGFGAEALPLQRRMALGQPIPAVVYRFPMGSTPLQVPGQVQVAITNIENFCWNMPF